jgi:hypothetical protein
VQADGRTDDETAGDGDDAEPKGGNDPDHELFVLLDWAVGGVTEADAFFVEGGFRFHDFPSLGKERRRGFPLRRRVRKDLIEV